MKIEQSVARIGDHLSITLTEVGRTRKVIGVRIWKDAAKYLVGQDENGNLVLRVPKRVGLNIKGS